MTLLFLHLHKDSICVAICVKRMHVVDRDLMSVAESSAENEGPIASRTCSRNVGVSVQSKTWCSCACATALLQQIAL